MYRYLVYIAGCRAQSEKITWAVSSFAARKAYVTERNARAGDSTLEISDCVAIRGRGFSK